MEKFERYFDQLPALDASIEKWKRVVFEDSRICEDCPLCLFNSYCDRCIIKQITEVEQCWNTPYPHTSIANIMRGYTIIKKEHRIHDNWMLSKLYEIRRQYIANYYQQTFYQE